RIQEQLAWLAEVLSDLSSRMKRIADQRRGGLGEFADAGAPGDTLSWSALLGDESPPAPAAAPKSRRPAPGGRPTIRYAQFVEFSTHAELVKFATLPPIRAEDIAAVDWEDLERRLLG
ncbi:MAG: hypothetical protein JXQ29_17275, partial [Planctomycetes bacterium]|nr:hypothetical protein [Planctomycetota bacterium]